MKLLAFLFLVAAASAERLENKYLPPASARFAGGKFLSTPFYNPYSRFGNPLAYQRTAEIAGKSTKSKDIGDVFTYNGVNGAPIYNSYAGPQVPILRQNNENDGFGNYRFNYETANHIVAEESGHLKNPDTSEVRGAYSYLAPNGQTISLDYIADENGFRAVGDHLPKAPAIPSAILQSLEFNAAEEARGVYAKEQYYSSLPEVIAARGYVTPNINNKFLPAYRQWQYGGYKY